MNISANVSLSAAADQHSNLARVMMLSIQYAEDGIVIADARLPDLPVIYVNDAFERITGYSRAEVLDRNMRFLQSEQTDQSQVDEIRLALREGRNCKVTMRNVRKDGTLFWNMVMIAPIRDENGHVTHFMGVQADVTERRRAEAEMAYALIHDRTTGLPGFEVLIDRTQKQIAASPWDPLCFLLVDIDRFFGFNQLLGYAGGDLLLKEIAKRLHEAAGTDARVARATGDKFIVKLPHCVPQKAIPVAERVRKRLADPFVYKGIRLVVSSTVGIASYPMHGMEAIDLVRCADKAVRMAKQQGGNQVYLCPDDQATEFEQRRALAASVCTAMRNDELELHYEPRIDSTSGCVAGFEALARWNRHPTGWIEPLHFIPVIETLGLMPEFGLWAIRESCRQIRGWRDAGYGELTISVNVSAQQLQGPGFVGAVKNALDEFALDGSALELEFSKGIFNLNLDIIRTNLAPVKALGVGLGLDDFGADQSSFAHLDLFGKLKIDRVHVAGLPGNEDSVAIAKTILCIGRNLNAVVVAEGIETASQRDLLISMGCRQLQGHLFGRAIPAHEVLPWLGANHSKR